MYKTYTHIDIHTHTYIHIYIYNTNHHNHDCQSPPKNSTALDHLLTILEDQLYSQVI